MTLVAERTTAPTSTRSTTTSTPHGGALVDRRATGSEAEELRGRATGLPVVNLSETQVADLEMIASGALSPLEGFVGKADYCSIIEDVRLADGTVWPFPITLRVDEAPATDEIALAAPDGTLLATMTVTEHYAADTERETRTVYGTTEPEHPGVALLRSHGEHILGGPVTTFASLPSPYPASPSTPRETRAQIDLMGWRTVVGFQTRNPVHRAHEYIVKSALELVDGLLLHPLVGRTKDGDIGAEVRMRCYEVLLGGYFPTDRTLLGVFPAAMRYAGPREAIFHALCRKNYGCTHFIVGRDHAGVGSYYGTYDAQRIFDRFDPSEIGIEIMRFEHSFFCRCCGSMASAKTCPHDAEHHVFLSGTKVREMLGRGEVPPAEFTRPEIAEVLIDAYADR